MGVSQLWVFLGNQVLTLRFLLAAHLVEIQGIYHME